MPLANETDSAALRDAQQGKAIDAGRFNYRFEILDKSFERKIGHLPIGETVTTLVVKTPGQPELMERA